MGGSITDGNATYSNFAYGGTTDPATVTVTTISSPTTSTIQFGRTAGTWTLADGNSVVSYHVAFAVPIVSMGLDFVATGDATSVASVGETAMPGFHSLQVITGMNFPSAFSDTEVFGGGGVSSLDIVKSIDTSGATGGATITTVDNSYTTVPEPASLAVLGLGGVALLRRRKK